MLVRVFDSPEALGEDLAVRLVTLIADAGRDRRPFLLGCPSGRSPRPVYQALARMIAAQQLSLAHVTIVMMDDYLVRAGGGFDHVDAESHFSCRRFARDEIVAVLNGPLPADRGIASDRIWFPDPGSPDAYDGRIARSGGIDFFILASGASDGHVAFNPQGSARESVSRIVPLAEATRRDNMKTFPDFNSIDEVPSHGITVGIDTIVRQSKAAAMILWGKEKKRAFQRISSAKGYDPAWPASVIASCRKAELLADRDAWSETAR
jgi:glucosamine-6-phosphate deaminase